MKHDNTNAFTHGRDVKIALELEDFRKHMMNDEGELKPIFINTTDGGSDEAPRYWNNLVVAVARFREHDLDAHIYTNLAIPLTTESSVAWHL